jgi:hypothetical protein
MTIIALILSFMCGLLIGRYILSRPVIVMPAVDLTEEEMQKIKSDLDRGSVVKLPTFFKKKKKGAIFMPDSEVEEARQAIIERNKAAGVDTPISELIEQDE